jgi:hypothetical protein
MYKNNIQNGKKIENGRFSAAPIGAEFTIPVHCGTALHLLLSSWKSIILLLQKFLTCLIYGTKS